MKIKGITDQDLDRAYDLLILTVFAMAAMVIAARLIGIV